MSIKRIVSEILPFVNNETKQEEISFNTPLKEDLNELEPGQNLSNHCPLNQLKISRSQYLIEKNTKKKINPIVSITKYITNAKYNYQQHSMLSKSFHSAFTSINDNYENLPQFNQRKEIINFNDFSSSHMLLKPLTLLTNKQKREEEEEYAQEGVQQDIQTKHIEQHTRSLFKTTNFADNDLKFNKGSDNNVLLKEPLSNNKMDNFPNTNCNEIHDKTTYEGKEQFLWKTPFNFDYTDRKRNLKKYYENKIQEQQEKRDYLKKIEEKQATFTDLLYRRNQSFVLEAKPKPKSIVYQINQAVKLNINQKHNKKLIFELDTNSFTFKGATKQNKKDQKPKIFEKNLLFPPNININANTKHDKVGSGLFQEKNELLFSSTQNDQSITNMFTKNNNRSLCLNNNTDSHSDILFQVPKEKQDEYKGAKYESVILDKVVFGVPNCNNTNKSNNQENETYKANKQKTILFTTKIFESSQMEINANSNELNTEKDKKETVLSLIKPIFGDKTDDFIQNKVDIKYDSVILNNVVFRAPQDKTIKCTLSNPPEQITVKENSLFGVPKNKTDGFILQDTIFGDLKDSSETKQVSTKSKKIKASHKKNNKLNKKLNKQGSLKNEEPKVLFPALNLDSIESKPLSNLFPSLFSKQDNNKESNIFSIQNQVKPSNLFHTNGSDENKDKDKKIEIFSTEFTKNSSALFNFLSSDNNKINIVNQDTQAKDSINFSLFTKEEKNNNNQFSLFNMGKKA